MQAPSPLRVLVIEDWSDTADSYAVLLRLWGHEVRIARDGASALKAAPGFLPDVVLLDLGLPELDGCEVARRLRQLPGLEAALLVAVTGHGREADRRRAREAGIDLYLLKPADPDELRRVLASAAKLTRPASA